MFFVSITAVPAVLLTAVSTAGLEKTLRHRACVRSRTGCRIAAGTDLGAKTAEDSRAMWWLRGAVRS